MSKLTLLAILLCGVLAAQTADPPKPPKKKGFFDRLNEKMDKLEQKYGTQPPPPQQQQQQPNTPQPAASTPLPADFFTDAPPPPLAPRGPLLDLTQPLPARPRAYCATSPETRAECAKIALVAAAQGRHDFLLPWIYPKWRNSGWTNPNSLLIHPDNSPYCGKYLAHGGAEYGYLDYEKCWIDYTVYFDNDGYLTDIQSQIRTMPTIQYDPARPNAKQHLQWVEDARRLIELAGRANPAKVSEALRAFGFQGPSAEGLIAFLRGEQKSWGRPGEPMAAKIQNCRLHTATIPMDGTKAEARLLCVYDNYFRDILVNLYFDKRQWLVSGTSTSSVPVQSRHQK